MENMNIFASVATRGNIAFAVCCARIGEQVDKLCFEFTNYDARRAVLAIVAIMVQRHPGMISYTLFTSDKYIDEAYNSSTVETASSQDWLVDGRNPLPYWEQWKAIITVTGLNLEVVYPYNTKIKSKGKTSEEQRKQLNDMHDFAMKCLEKKYEPMPPKAVPDGMQVLTQANESADKKSVTKAAPVVATPVAKAEPVVVAPVTEKESVAKTAPKIEVPVVDDSIGMTMDDMVMFAGGTTKFAASENDLVMMYEDSEGPAMIDPNFTFSDDDTPSEDVVVKNAPQAVSDFPVVPVVKVEESKLEKPALIAYYNWKDGFHVKEFDLKSVAETNYGKLVKSGLLVFMRLNGELQYSGIPADDKCFSFTNMKVFRKNGIAFKVEFSKKIYVEDDKYCKKIAL